jgi:hypothetical protein
MPRRTPRPAPTFYNALHILFASDSKPMSPQKITYQLTRMAAALDALRYEPAPHTHKWRVLSDAINLLETLVTEGEAPIHDAQGRVIASHWRDCDGDAVEVRDSSGLLLDAITAMAQAGERAMDGKPLRLSGPGLHAVAQVLADYEAALRCLPERTMVRCHKKTEERVRKAMARAGGAPAGVQVIAL